MRPPGSIRGRVGLMPWLGLLGLLGACAAVPCQPEAGDVLPVAMLGGHPLVPVGVNGRAVPFLLDTGASHTSLVPGSVAALGLQHDTLRKSRAVGIGGESEAQNVLMARFRVGARELRGLTLPVAQAQGRGFAGLVGMDLLRVSEVELDFPSRRVVLHDARSCVGPGGAWAEAYGTLPLTITPQGLLVVRVVANGHPMRALFDTGAAATVMRQGVATRAGVPEAVLARPVDGWTSGVGPAMRGVRRHLLPELRVWEEVLRDVPVGIVETSWDLPFEMVLGMDYMASRRFWISYDRQRLHVQRAGAEARVPVVGRATATVP